ncbi:alpha/beta hydrolase [Paludibacter sp.]|uniref:alpha/beta hydrolase family protein n=1 Tax=Paludibacter sp. TaxID=1898105 RepID=UPI0013556F27|nr:alpha/beta hydrolase [Paludibacter sp.]MTK52776.1 alpha/beta hydrolase [Paludibacter sp.]
MKRIFFVSIVSLFFTATAFALVTKTTFVYAIKGADTLRLDRYEAIQDSSKSNKPCLLFMFGGGFVGGHRDWKGYTAYFEKMAEKGYSVFSIDYRLGLKPVAERMRKGEKVRKLEFPHLLENAIDTAVADLYDATRFILNKSNDWKIEPNNIVINGSSAGAVSVLQAEYYLCSGNELIKKLPENFRYAGVISFAGAIFSTKGALHWDKQPSPIQFFHGDADSNVPYNKVRILKFGFYGSKNLAEQFDKLKSPYYFYDVENAAHEIAQTPMTSNIGEIEEFLTNMVQKKQPLEIHKQVRQTDKPVMKKKFGIGDYIGANFKPSN